MQTFAARPATERFYPFGEGLRHDPAARGLLWVDITAGRFLRAPLGDLDDVTEMRIDGPLGAVAPAVGGGWVAAAGRGLSFLAPEGTRMVLAELEPATNRMNDAACDPSGRFWAGSMAWDAAEGAGSLHRLELDGSVTLVRGDLSIANGPAWSPDGSVLYLNDSGRSRLLAFDVDAGGALRGERVLVDFADGAGDGLTVDDEGHLWVAVFGAGAVHRYDPAGRLVAIVELPVAQVTCCCLADGRLFISTTSKEMEHPEPDAGRLFVADVGVDGPGVRPYRGRLPAAATG